MTKEELKPCPFCGSTDIRLALHPSMGRWKHQGEDLFSIDCYDCGASVPNRYQKELIIACWNKRVEKY